MSEDADPYEGLPGPAEGGVGFTPYYTGISGTVPIGADPSDGEPMTGKKTEIVWVEITHSED